MILLATALSNRQQSLSLGQSGTVISIFECQFQVEKVRLSSGKYSIARPNSLKKMLTFKDIYKDVRKILEKIFFTMPNIVLRIKQQSVSNARLIFNIIIYMTVEKI